MIGLINLVWLIQAWIPEISVKRLGFTKFYKIWTIRETL